MNFPPIYISPDDVWKLQAGYFRKVSWDHKKKAIKIEWVSPEDVYKPVAKE